MPRRSSTFPLARWSPSSMTPPLRLVGVQTSAGTPSCIPGVLHRGLFHALEAPFLRAGLAVDGALDARHQCLAIAPVVDSPRKLPPGVLEDDAGGPLLRRLEFRGGAAVGHREVHRLAILHHDAKHLELDRLAVLHGAIHRHHQPAFRPQPMLFRVGRALALHPRAGHPGEVVEALGARRDGEECGEGRNRAVHVVPPSESQRGIVNMESTVPMVTWVATARPSPVMRTATIYALVAVGSAAHSSKMRASMPSMPTSLARPHAIAGTAPSFTASHHACAAGGPWPLSMRIAAPTARSPAGSAVTARRFSVWSANDGSGNPSAFHARPTTEATTNGCVASS